MGLGFLMGGARVRWVFPPSKLRSRAPLEPDLSEGLSGLAQPGSDLGGSRVILSLPLLARDSLL